MAYPATTGEILAKRGYVADTDFVAHETGGVVTLTWLHPDPKPDDLTVASWEIDVARADKITETKAEAGRRIVATYPQTAQANLQAYESLVVTLGLYKLAVALQDTEVQAALQPAWDAVGGTMLPNSATIVADAVNAMLAFIKPIRDASDLIEADILALPNDPDAIRAFDVAGSTRWPA